MVQITHRSSETRIASQPPWVYAEYGQGRALAVVMAPVMPWWDEGRFFAPMTERLVALGYRVMIFDTLALDVTEAATLADFTGAWRQLLQALGPVQLLAGNALGGAVVQGLLASDWARDIPAALLISAPTQADARLNCRLGAMADLARCGRLEAALRMLERWVAPQDEVLPFAAFADHPPQALQRAAARLSRGFDLLQDVDLRAAVSTFRGQLLSVYGEQSQLVCANNVSFPRTAKHLALSIAGSGMRAHIEQPAAVWACVQEHLRMTAQATS